MTEIKLMECLKMIVKEMKMGSKNEEDFMTQYLLPIMDFRGSRNQHLANPKMEGCHFGVEREIPLNENELVYGDFLLFWGVGHDDRYVVYDMDSLEEIEDFIKDIYENTFTTDMIPIIRGKFCPFHLEGINRRGNTVIFQKRVNGTYFLKYVKKKSRKVVWKG